MFYYSWIGLPRTLPLVVLLAVVLAILALNRPGVTPSAGAVGMDSGGFAVSGTGTPVVPQQASGDYDADDDGLIEVSNLAQLDAIRYDLDGDGSPANARPGAYAAAFPGAVAGMGCPELSGCTGYELVADLDFDTNGNGRTDSGDAYWNDRAGWQPIGRGVFSGSRPEFLSTFDGGGHTIANLYINRQDDYIGLFGSIGSRAEIRDVGLTDVNVTGPEFRDWVGGLVGFSGGSVSGSYATGTVSGGDDVGGLVGRSGGSISGSYATGAVTGDSNVGGLVGSSGGSIGDSYATGAVTGDSSVGGLVGSSNGTGSSISGSYATGAVSGESYVGGLAGISGSNISGSYAAGAVTGDRYLGGLVGFGAMINISASYATGAVTGSGSPVGGLVGFGDVINISASYATGAVTGSGAFFGGLVGRSGGSISASYATGTVTGDNIVGGLVGYHRNGNISGSYAIGRLLGADEVGGLVGRNHGAVTNSYWDTVASGRSDSDGGQGKTTSELQSSTGYTGIYAGWNLDLDNADRDRDLSTDGDDPWDFGTSSQYPALKYGGLDVSAQRGGQTQTPEAPAEDIPLGPPTNVQATVSNGDVTITWTNGANADRHIAILFDTNWQFAPAHLGDRPDGRHGDVPERTVRHVQRRGDLHHGR